MANDNPYLPLVQNDTQQSMRISMLGAADKNPDTEAELQSLAQQYGVPVDSVRLDKPAYQRRAKLDALDYSSLAQQYPATSNLIADPNKAAIAHDDVPALTGTEGALSKLNGPYLQQGPAPSYKERAVDWFRSLLGMGPSSDVRDEGAAARAFIADTARREGTTVQDLRQAVGGMSDVPMQFSQGFANSASAGLAPDQAGNPTTGSGEVARGVGDLTGFLFGAPLAASKYLVGKAAGSLLDVGEGSSILKAGIKDIIHQAATLGTASAISATGQALNANNTQDLLKAYGHAGLSGAEMGATFGAAGRFLPDNTIAHTFGRVLGVNAALDLQNGTTPGDNRSLEQKVMDYGLNTLFSFRGAGRPGGSWLHDAARADIATQDGQALQDLNDMAASSKLRQRDPAVFQDFIRQATEDSPVQDVYIDPKTFTETLAQSGVDPAEVAAKVPSVGDQLAQASVIGQDLRIPVDEFATHMAGEEYAENLIPHLKTDPNGMSQAEAQDFMQSHADRLQQDVARVLTEKQGDDAFKQSADTVEANVRDQLEKANRFKPDVNDAYAKMVASHYLVRAAQMGTTPEALFEQYPLHIQAEPVTGDALNQGTGKDRGSYAPGAQTISLLKNADLSTFLHESGHHFLEMTSHLAQRPDAPQQIKDDMAALHKWFGVKDHDAWNALSLDEKRPHHEQFARGFESYLFEGKAPSIQLQGVFQRFRSWIMHVYRGLLERAKGNIGEALDVDLNHEVRGVFDRMLATSEQIKEAEAARSMAPMFRSAEEAGMNPDEWRAYQDLGRRATQDAVTQMESRSLRDMQWLSNAKAKVLKAMQKDAADKRKAIREEITKEVMAQPINQARNWLRKGETTDPATGEQIKAAKGFKLNSEALKEMYPEASLADRPALDKLRGMTSKDGLHPDIVADIFGFRNGDDLVRNLIDSPSAKEMIDGLTDQRMLERHGDLTDPQAMDRAADLAIHNDARARFIATEMNALNKAIGQHRLLAAAAKEFAKNMIDRLKVRDVKPSEYTAAEARAARNADDARKQGDLATAAAEKRNQLIHNYAAKAAMNVQAEVDKGLNYLKRFDRPGVREAIDVDYRDQIDALLDRFDLRKSTSLRELDKRESLLAFVERMAGEGYEPNVPEALLNEAQRQHYKDMTVEQFRGLVDAVKSIDHLGRLKNRLLDLKETRDLQAVADEARETMAKLPQHDPESNRGLTRMQEKWLNAKAAGRSAQTATLKMEQMFDWLDGRDPNGVMNRVAFRRIADAGVRQNDMLAQVKAGIDDLMHANLEDVTKDRGRIYTAEGLIDGLTGEPQRFTKKQMLALAGNMGNDSNVAKLVKGENWSEAAIWDFLHKNMTKADWDYVAGIGKALESLWPEKLAMSRRLGNTNPEKIEPRPFDTPFGRYDGWYWPMIYDPARSQDVAERGARKTDQMFENIYTRANTDTGRMNTRNANYARPLLLDLDAIPRVIMDEIHDITHREAIIDVDKFISHPDVRKSIISALSQQHYDQIRPWLQSIANDGKLDDSSMRALKWFNDLAHGARTRATIVGLGYRISTMMVHGMSAGLESVAELGPRWFAAGLQDFANPLQWHANTEFVFERSGEMRHRMNEVDRDVREHLREIDLRMMDPATGAIQRGSDIVKSHAYQGIAMLDMASALPTWMGAYKKAMTPESQGGLGMSESDAVYFADKTVRNAHGGTGVKDLAAVQRGPEFFKLFTMFYTFWNHNVNRLMDTARLAGELPDTYRSGDMQKFRGDLGTVIMRTLIYTIGVQLMHGLLHPPKESDGEEGWAKWALKELGSAATAGVPLIRDIASHYIQGKDYSATPAAGMVDTLGKSGQDVMYLWNGQQASDKWLKHTLTTAGYVFGLPTGQASSAMQFLWDVADGKQDPQGISDWWHGILHGDMKKH